MHRTADLFPRVQRREPDDLAHAVVAHGQELESRHRFEPHSDVFAAGGTDLIENKWNEIRTLSLVSNRKTRIAIIVWCQLPSTHL